MPIKIPRELPAYNVLQGENIFVINDKRAESQDIRPLKIGILNLMPKKIDCENQILRYLSNTPLQVEIKLIQTQSYTSHNTPKEHLDKFYSYFNDIKNEKFDGFIITGAPVEKLEYEEVAYWDELTEIMEWTKKNVYSTLHICWGAQAGLYYHHNINKYKLPQKKFGIFKHVIYDEKSDITKGLDDEFYAPHSRHTEVRVKDVEDNSQLEIVSASKEAGVFIVKTKDNRQLYITGHLEYDRETLKEEYFRDIKKGLKVDMPKHYFPDDDCSKKPIMKWRASAHIVFANWLNYCIYQNTPFDIKDIK